jgi:lipid II:glycine glycyltransferase (peptidoglycan interpeptide bridge formation enzyme)
VLHLLRWRAIQQAIAEGRDQMDLGGVDVAGARRPPRPDEQMYGLYQHKASFGARWVELSGAHERVFRRARYAVGRAASRLAAIGPARR